MQKFLNFNPWSAFQKSELASLNSRQSVENCLSDVSLLYSENSIQTLLIFLWVNPQKIEKGLYGVF